ncbi:Transposon TX1 uncharacterized 149 kDa protein [Linum grandiflorum]
MHPDKARSKRSKPGFFQYFWETIGRVVAQDCMRWMEEMSFPTEVRKTNIVLLTRKEDPIDMWDVRPISLCDVRYLMVAKVLANRLWSIMPDIIPEEQSGFIRGWSTIDNVLIAFETLHALNLQRRAKHGEATLKIDISKADDRVEWTYLKAIMLKLGFSSRWVDLMLLCVRTVEYSVNTISIQSFAPGRGLRQGCPLSPFLFVI